MALPKSYGISRGWPKIGGQGAPVPPPPPGDEIRMNMIAQTFTGGSTPADVGATVGMLTSQGLPVTSEKTLIFPRSMSPALSPWTQSPNSGGFTVTAAETIDGFSTVDIVDSGFGSARLIGSTQSVTAGDRTVMKIRFGTRPGQANSGGIRIGINGSGNNRALISGSDILGTLTGNPAGVAILSRRTGTTNVSGTDFNWQELILLVTAQTTGTQTISIRSATSGTWKLYGAQEVIGWVDTPWTPTATTALVVPGVPLPVSGALLTALNSTSGWLVLGTQDIANAPPVTLLSRGSSTGLENTILSMTADRSSCRIPSGTDVVTGQGGYPGITLTGITWNASSYKVQVNGGEIVGVNSPLSSGPLWVLLATADGYIREINAKAVFLTDSQLTAETDPALRTFQNVGTGISLGASVQTFNDVFKNLADSDILKTRLDVAGNNFATFPSVPNKQAIVAQYSQTGPNGRAKWNPRLTFDSTNTGSGPSGGQINGEYQAYIDFQYGVPRDIPSPYSRASDNSWRIIGTRTSTLSAPAQALVPTRGATGITLPYVSGSMNTDGSFQQKFGYFEVRCRLPAVDVDFPCPLWLIPGALTGHYSEAEIDGQEIFGANTDAKPPSQYTGSLHFNNYNNNLPGVVSVNTGIDFRDGWNTFGVLWQQGKITWYLNGKQIGSPYTYTAVNNNLDTYPMIIQFNYAIGANFIGAPSGTRSGVADGMYMDHYYVVAWQAV